MKKPKAAVLTTGIGYFFKKKIRNKNTNFKTYSGSFKIAKVGILNKESYSGGFKIARIGIRNEEVYSGGFKTSGIGYLQNKKIIKIKNTNFNPMAAVLKRHNSSIYCGSFLKRHSRISIAAV